MKTFFEIYQDVAAATGTVADNWRFSESRGENDFFLTNGAEQQTVRVTLLHGEVNVSSYSFNPRA